jgi:hypothetical protein
MTPEEARAMLAACICTGSLFAACALGVLRLFIGQFGAMCVDTDTLGEFMLDQAIFMGAWVAMFLLGMSVCSMAFLGRSEVPGGDAIAGVGIASNLAAYFGLTWLLLLYRHFVMYHGVHRRLARAKMWRDASRRIDLAIGSSTHVQEIEDAYDKLYAMTTLLDNDYSPFRFKVRDARFTAGMVALRVSAALVIMLLSVKLAGGAP